jgi:hypothetical protein
VPASIEDHALTVGFSRGFEVAAGIGLLALLITIATIRVSRRELAVVATELQELPPQPRTAQPVAGQPAVLQPATEQRNEDRAALAAAARPCRFC